MSELWEIYIVLKSKDNQGRAEDLRRNAVKDLSIDDKYVQFTTTNGSEYMVRMEEVMFLVKKRLPERRGRSGAVENEVQHE